MPIKLIYFKPGEFQGWYDKIDTELLVKLDQLRHEWGSPIHISTVPGAVGRYAGKSRSRHNVDCYGKVLAIDIFPENIVYDRKEALEFYYLAKEIGFSGIGMYPRFNPSIGFHLDLREKFVNWVDIAKYPDHNYRYGYIEKYCQN